MKIGAGACGSFFGRLFVDSDIKRKEWKQPWPGPWLLPGVCPRSGLTRSDALSLDEVASVAETATGERSVVGLSKTNTYATSHPDGQ